MQSVHSGVSLYVSLLWVFGAFGINFAFMRWMSGWSKLVAHYAHRSAFVGQKWSWQSTAIGWLSYRGCVTVGANAAGLYIAPWWLYRGGHPPILIPWSALPVDGPQWWWLMRVYSLRPKSCPKVVIRVPQGLFQKLAVAADGQFAFK